MPKRVINKITTIKMSPLFLMRQIRDVMAQPGDAQKRLDQVARVIAAGFVSEVCSVYLLRAGDILELFASQGLKKTSIHLTRLNVGRGLVGDIAATAQPLSVADAASHPKFEYRPETGEEVYKSFVGVPILQGGKVIGVLVVQGKKAKRYSQAQVEVLQTVAMVLSELIMSGQLVDPDEIQSATGGLMTQQLSGVALSSGIAKAPAVLHRPQLVITRYVAADIVHEKTRFEAAIAALQESLTQFMQAADKTLDEEQRLIIETYLLFTQDKGWLSRIREAIVSGLTAEAAVKKVQEELQVKMNQMASPYIKERIQDLEDLSNRLLMVLLGKPAASAPHHLPKAFVLVARTLGPADLLDYDHTCIKGLILEEGSTTSHTAVIARGMDIPALAKVERATSLIADGDIVILDAEGGNVFVRPDDKIEQEMEQHLQHYASRAAEYETLRDKPAVTKDGVRISLNVNAGLFIDPDDVLQEGVDGIGLYRTELPYMTSDNFPDAEVQRQLYARVYEQLPKKSIIFRSFDIGGDKKVPYLHTGQEENPAMGWRATRIGLDHPGILRTQFKAMIAAASGRPLAVMFPFIAEVSEFDAARKLFDQELAHAKEEEQKPPKSVTFGVMIEIPSLLWQLDALLPRLDFVSIGSNDLMQFLFACDRTAPHIAGNYDTLSPVMLRVVQDIVAKAAAHKTEVCFCGEMARKPLDALALIGLGIRNLSVSASAIGPLKAMIRSVDLSALAHYLPYAVQSSEDSVRHWLAAYARDHNISV